MTLSLIVMTTVLAMCVLLSWLGSAPDEEVPHSDDLERNLWLQRDNAGAYRTGFVAPGAAELDEFADDGLDQLPGGEVTSEDERETA